MGLNSKQKLLGQIIGGIVFYLVFRSEGISNSLTIPLIGTINLGIFYALFVLVELLVASV